MKQEKFVVKLPFELWNLLSLRMILKMRVADCGFLSLTFCSKKKERKIENENFQKLNTKKYLNIILHNLFKFNN